jgi:hypothetical protein
MFTLLVSAVAGCAISLVAKGVCQNASRTTHYRHHHIKFLVCLMPVTTAVIIVWYTLFLVLWMMLLEACSVVKYFPSLMESHFMTRNLQAYSFDSMRAFLPEVRILFCDTEILAIWEQGKDVCASVSCARSKLRGGFVGRVFRFCAAS